MEDALASSIRADLRSRATVEAKRVTERLVPGPVVLGVPVPALRALTRELRSAHPALTLGEAMTFLDSCCANRVREEMLLGIFLVGSYGRAVRGIRWLRIRAWLDAVDNWETCDQLANATSVPLLHAHPHLQTELEGLARSDGVWERRFVLATAVGLNQGGRRHVAIALELCETLRSDPERMVQKAIAWTIRQVTKTDPEAAAGFLAANQQALPVTTVRAASKGLVLLGYRMDA